MNLDFQIWQHSLLTNRYLWIDRQIRTYIILFFFLFILVLETFFFLTVVHGPWNFESTLIESFWNFFFESTSLILVTNLYTIIYANTNKFICLFPINYVQCIVKKNIAHANATLLHNYVTYNISFFFQNWWFSLDRNWVQNGVARLGHRPLHSFLYW